MRALNSAAIRTMLPRSSPIACNVMVASRSVAGLGAGASDTTRNRSDPVVSCARIAGSNSFENSEAAARSTATPECCGRHIATSRYRSTNWLAACRLLVENFARGPVETTKLGFNTKRRWSLVSTVVVAVVLPPPLGFVVVGRFGDEPLQPASAKLAMVTVQPNFAATRRKLK